MLICQGAREADSEDSWILHLFVTHFSMILNAISYGCSTVAAISGIGRASNKFVIIMTKITFLAAVNEKNYIRYIKCVMNANMKYLSTYTKSGKHVSKSKQYFVVRFFKSNTSQQTRWSRFWKRLIFLLSLFAVDFFHGWFPSSLGGVWLLASSHSHLDSG